MTVLDDLTALEHDGWASLCDGTGDRFYGDLMLGTALMVLAGGLVMDRDAVVASLGEAPPWQRYEISDEQLVEVTDGAALVYRARAWRDGDDAPFEAAMSSLYVRRDTGWRLALYQQTPST